jgi:NAD(P)-dependent dehydrogenase (short-subunit alcohol dehydrogenase family)
MEANRQMPLSGKHALVTGGNRGIGLAIAHALAQAGAAVTIVGRDRAKLVAALDELKGRAGFAIADVTMAADVEQAFSDAAKARGAIDILINNAGAAESAPFGKTTEALWDRMLAVNLTSTYLCSQRVLPGMVAAKWGRIVNIASTAGLKGYPYVTAYCAAKHGVVGLTRALALETAKQGVTVNAVCPGYTETDMVERTLDNITAKTGRSREAARDELAKHNPLGRLIKPEEVAEAVVWLCRSESGAITGQTIAVDGGEV